MASTSREEYISSLYKELGGYFNNRIPDDNVLRDRALTVLKRLTTALEKPKDALFQHVFQPNHLLCTRIAVDLDLFNLILREGRPKTAEELAKACGAEKHFLVRILRVLVAYGFINEVGEQQYAPTPMTETLVDRTNVAMIKHCFDVAVPSIIQIPEYLKKYGYNDPSQNDITPFQFSRQITIPYFSWLQQHPQLSSNFNTFMQGNRGNRVSWLNWFPIQEQVLDGFNEEQSPFLMIDIAGGYGHDLMAFHSKHPQASGRLILQDQPHVIDKTYNLSEKIEPTSHDIFTPQPVRGARVYFFHFILHDWSDEKCLTILKNTASAMTKGYSKLLLNELILPDQACPILPALYDMQMMAVPAGMERSQTQWRTLLEASGLELTKFWQPPGEGEGIVEAMLKE